MEKMNEICKMILELNEEDYVDAANVINSQKEYVNPLRLAAQGWQNELGNHKKMIEMLNTIRELMDDKYKN